jgi:hypothetical protein
MGYYDNILNLISVVLALAILFIIIFGCQFKKHRYIERFTNGGEEEGSEETEETTSVPPPPASPTDEKKEGPQELSELENRIYEGLKSGSIEDSEIQNLIDNNIFKRENLEHMLNYIEQFKNPTIKLI